MDFPGIDDVLNSNVVADSYGKRGKAEKPPEVKVPWCVIHYVALAVGLFAAVCVVYALLSTLLT